MTMLPPINIDLTESFPHLTKAPVVEAAIQILTRPGVSLEEAKLLETLKEKLPDYTDFESHRSINYQIVFSPESKVEPKDMGWSGVRCKTADGLQVANFGKDGFAFSRLKPYVNWEQFSNEALRLWAIYLDLAKPVEVQRLGLRFINRLILPIETAKLRDYFVHSSRAPDGLELPLIAFFNQNTFAVPEHDLAIQISQTREPFQSPTKEVGLILDIDAFTLKGFEIKDDVLQNRLNQLRWLKNKAFFGSVTQQVIGTVK
jgi:uncharacterized protein (TIGR04255 family)